MLARPFQIWVPPAPSPVRHRHFGDTECFNAVNATLVYGCFNMRTAIPDLGTTHPLSWVGCEKILETL